MSKKLFHDIIPKEKRSIRNIPLTIKIESEGDSNSEVSPETPTQNTPNLKHATHTVDGIRPKSDTQQRKLQEIESKPTFEYGEASNDTFNEWRKNNHTNTYVRGIVGLSIIGIIVFFVISTLFSKATIRINPVKHDFVLKEAQIRLTDVGHELSNSTFEDSEEVSVSGTVKVERKATGTVILYNAFNSVSQKLVAGTRLETPNGLIYKLKTSATIPGQKTVNGKKVPGSVEVVVEASEIGDSYNQGLRDFKVVAYKNSDRYETVYGRSKTTLTGGFSGTVPNISQKETDAVVEILKKKINTQADTFFSDKAKSKGSTFTYLPTTKRLQYEAVKNEISKDGKKATISLTAEGTAIVFDSASLFAEIIKKQTEETGGSSSTKNVAENTTEAKSEIVYTGDLTKLNIATDIETVVTVTGTTTISSAIDDLKIAKAVSGLSKEQAIGAIKRLVELETIEIDIRPWWNKKLPATAKIVIEIES